MGRAPCCEKVGLKRGRWTAEEDEILMRYIQVNGQGSWRSLPKSAGLLRCGKSCRLRWINYLRADLKRGNISPEEEETIVKLHGSFGNRWSLIAAHLPGRTDNEIKNYWNSHLRLRIHRFRRLNNVGVPGEVDLGNMVHGCKRRGGRTRRSAMKKNQYSYVEMRREKLHARAGTLSTIPLPQKPTLKAVQGRDNEVSMVPSEEKANGVTGPQEEVTVMESWNVGSSNKESESEIFVSNKGLENELFFFDEVRESGVAGFTEEIESGIWGSNEQSESGATVFKEQRENGGMGENEGRFNSEKDIHELCSNSLDNSFEEMGYFHEGLDWKWDGEGDVWSWLWESDNEEANCLATGHEQEKYAAWLLSADSNEL